MTKLKFKPSAEYKAVSDRIFQKLKSKILEIMPNADIQHIGSTAISEAITKGDLDIQIRISKEDFFKARKYLRGHYRVNQLENWSTTFASFKDDNSFEMPIGIQLTVINSEEDRLFQKQQFLLANNAEILEKYNQTKLKFNGRNINDYRKARAKFFKDLKL